MHRFLGLVLALLAAALPVRAEEPADSIQAVIVSQLDALQANDLTAAFAHASPTIQSKFGTPEVFGRMVETGYPVIWRPARYEMWLIDGAWRINGVYLRALPGVGS